MTTKEALPEKGGAFFVIKLKKMGVTIGDIARSNQMGSTLSAEQIANLREIGSSDEKKEQIRKYEASRSNKQGGNGEAWTGVAGSFINNLGGILGGIGSIIGASKGTPQNVNYYEERNNGGSWGTYLLIGGGLLVVVVVVIILATRNK